MIVLLAKLNYHIFMRLAYVTISSISVNFITRGRG